MATQQMSTQQNRFLKYDASVETIRPNEQQIFDELAVNCTKYFGKNWRSIPAHDAAIACQKSWIAESRADSARTS